MDIGTVRGLITLALFLSFLGLVAWAWSSKRRREFDAAALLPLEEDPIEDHLSQAGSHE